jgi:MEDS: MEthanogen/methylotroph, DcmR Sensory domain
MAAELRKTGISVVGDMPWGTHLCHFYETKQDLLDILIPYFKAGLEHNEFCMWVTCGHWFSVIGMTKCRRLAGKPR